MHFFDGGVDLCKLCGLFLDLLEGVLNAGETGPD